MTIAEILRVPAIAPVDPAGSVRRARETLPRIAVVRCGRTGHIPASAGFAPDAGSQSRDHGESPMAAPPTGNLASLRVPVGLVIPSPISRRWRETTNNCAGARDNPPETPIKCAKAQGYAEMAEPQPAPSEFGADSIRFSEAWSGSKTPRHVYR